MLKKRKKRPRAPFLVLDSALEADTMCYKCQYCERTSFAFTSNFFLSSFSELVYKDIEVKIIVQ